MTRCSSKTRSTTLTTSLSLFLLFLVACGGKSGDDGAAKTGEGGKKYGGVYHANILRGNPKGLDPVLINSKHADDIASQVFDRLVDLNAKLDLVPELAKTLPKISADGRIYTFDLRTDVYFHDDPCFPGSKGRRLTAEDVRYSFTRCCDPRTSSVAYWAFQDKVKGANRYHDEALALMNAAAGRPSVGTTSAATPAATPGATPTATPANTPANTPSAKPGDKAAKSAKATKKSGDTSKKKSSGKTDTNAGSTTPPESPSPTPSPSPSADVVAPIEGFRVLNDSTFEIELVAPYAPFVYYLVNSLGDVVPREAVEKYGADFFRHPVGSGPFVFSSWVPDRELVLKRNPKYWGTDGKGNKLPFLDELRFSFIKDDKLQFNEFLSGKLSECFGVPTERFPEVVDSSHRATPAFEKFQVQAVPAMLTWFFDFNNQMAPFNNADVRRAFNYAVDRERLVRFVLQNSPYAPAHNGLVPPVFRGYPIDSVKGYTYNPEEAKRLMAAAGYPNGAGFPQVTLHIYPEPRLSQVAQAVQQMIYQTLNININIQVMEFPQLLDQAESGKLAFWGTRWYGDYPDPETFLLLLFGELVPKAPNLPSYPNSSRYNNPLFNESFKKGVATIDHVAQMKHYSDAEKVAMADAPLIPLFYEMHYRLLQSTIRDNPLDAMARVDLKYVWIDREG